MKVFRIFLLVFFMVTIIKSNNMDIPAKHVELPALFTDNMVLQQGVSIPVWGTAEPGGFITVTIDEQNHTVQVGDDGTWKVTLEALEAGGPLELHIIGEETIIIKNVMVGEVWICSGQSNMEMPLAGWGRVDNYEEEIANANYPNIRLLTVKRSFSATPLDTINSEGWEICTPENIELFSSTAYFFGRNLHKNLEVPVGLIHTSWGGTPAEAWISGTELEDYSPFDGYVKKLKEVPDYLEIRKKEYLDNLNDWLVLIDKTDKGINKDGNGWFAESYDDSEWKQIPLPIHWEKSNIRELEKLDGIVWFRKEIEIPESMQGKDLKFYMGIIDDTDITYLNAEQIGTSRIYQEETVYKVSKEVILPGKNVIAMRIFDWIGFGGISGRAEDFRIEDEDGNRVSLAGEWMYKISLDLKDVPPRPQSFQEQYYPSTLYNAMIAPVIPYAMRGVIWYQGESNAYRAYEYRNLFQTLIKNWRELWGQHTFPFYFVQLSNYQSRSEEPTDNAWAELREAQVMALSLPETGMAVTIDIGMKDDIHPKNKQEVGRRLALIARAKTYGEDVVHSGPLYKSMEVEGNKIRLYFHHIDGGLELRDSEPNGFAIAGEDKQFYWADAVIDGETIVVSSDEVDAPVAVRYAWDINPYISLYNKAGLPASPFRTDRWDGITKDAVRNY